MNKNMYKGYICAILSAVIFGCMPLMAKYIYADGVNPMTLVFLRNLFALPSLAALAILQNKSLRIPREALPNMSVIAVVGCCVTPLLLFSSYQFIASGTATVFHFIYPCIVVLAGILFFGKKAHSGSIISVIICALGVSFFYTPGEPLDLRGSVLALASGFTFAAYVLMLSNFRHREVSGFRFSFHVTLISSLVMAAVCITSGSLALPRSLFGWLMCIFFAMLVTTGAVVLFQQGTFIIGGERSSILSTLEPTTSVIVGILVFGEALSIRTVLGTVLVIAASILIALSDMHGKKAESPEAP